MLRHSHLLSMPALVNPELANSFNLNAKARLFNLPNLRISSRVYQAYTVTDNTCLKPWRQTESQVDASQHKFIPSKLRSTRASFGHRPTLTSSSLDESRRKVSYWRALDFDYGYDYDLLVYCRAKSRRHPVVYYVNY